MTLVVTGTADEATAIAAHLEWDKEYDWNGYQFREARFPTGEDVVMVQCGVGKVQSAMVTQHAVDQFSPDRILMFGAAGALNPDVQIGDVIIATETVQHDMDATILGLEPGTIPYTDFRVIPCDAELVRTAQAVSVPELPKMPELDEVLDDDPEHERLHSGRVASGDQFVSDSFDRIELNESFDAIAVEMEGASVGLVAHVNGVPFVLVRTVSDRSDGSAVEFEKFITICSAFSWHYMSGILKALTS